MKSQISKKGSDLKCMVRVRNRVFKGLIRPGIFAKMGGCNLRRETFETSFWKGARTRNLFVEKFWAARVSLNFQTAARRVPKMVMWRLKTLIRSEKSCKVTVPPSCHQIWGTDSTPAGSGSIWSCASIISLLSHWQQWEHQSVAEESPPA